MKKNILIILSFLLIFAVSCENVNDKQTDEGIQGDLTSFTTCKSLKNYYSTDSIAVNQSCIEFTYLNETLYITHVNAGFNCCPGVLSSGFLFDGNNITISEYEESPMCNCDCLYDLEIEITGLQLDLYHFIFNEPYWDESYSNIEFSINLNDSTSGSYCVMRDIYPWGLM